MSPSHLEQNDSERERLFTLTDRLSEPELRALVHGEWTISATLAHLAFWDRLAMGFFQRRAAGNDIDDGTPGWYDHVLNDAVLPESMALAPADAVRLVREAASAIDAAVASLDVQAVDALAAEDSWLLRRHRHRREHLDEIEQALAVRSR